MPAGDRTGPWGMGPRTGRGFGYCSGFQAPGFMYPGPGLGYGRGFGFGRGFGRGMGFGRGRGFRRAWFGGAYGYPYPAMTPFWGPHYGGMPYSPYPPVFGPFYGQPYPGQGASPAPDEKD